MPRESSLQAIHHIQEFIGHLMNCGSEEGFSHGEEGDRAGRSRYIDEAAGEAANDPLRLLNHNRPIAVDDLGLEERRQHAPPSLPVLAVAGEEVVADDASKRALLIHRLVQRFSPGHQHFVRV